MKLLLVISSSQIGGAEKQFIKHANLLSTLYEVHVCVIGPKGPMRKRYQLLNCHVEFSDGSIFEDLKLLRKCIMEFTPDVTINWLYRADILGAIVSKIYKIEKILNSSRNVDWPSSSIFKLKLLQFVAKYFATGFISNSKKARDWHISKGYPADKFTIIPNLIDMVETRELKPFEVRKFWIGIASRPVPGKGHEKLINVIKGNMVLRKHVGLKFIGPGIPDWKWLKATLESSHLDYTLQDFEEDLEFWFKEIDIYAAISTSWESDSNSLLEAILHCKYLICSEIQNMSMIEIVPPIISLVNFEADLESQLLSFLHNENIELKNDLFKRRDCLVKDRAPVLIAQYWTLAFTK